MAFKLSQCLDSTPDLLLELQLLSDDFTACEFPGVNDRQTEAHCRASKESSLQL